MATLEGVQRDLQRLQGTRPATCCQWVWSRPPISIFELSPAMVPINYRITGEGTGPSESRLSNSSNSTKNTSRTFNATAAGPEVQNPGQTRQTCAVPPLTSRAWDSGDRRQVTTVLPISSLRLHGSNPQIPRRGHGHGAPLHAPGSFGVGSGLGAPAACRIYPPNRRRKLLAPAAGLPGYCNATLVSTPNSTG